MYTFVVNWLPKLTAHMQRELTVPEGPIDLLVDGHHDFHQLLILQLSLTRFVAEPFVITRPWNPRDLAQKLYAERFCLLHGLYNKIDVLLLVLAQRRLLWNSCNFFRNAFSALRRSISYSSFFKASFC